MATNAIVRYFDLQSEREPPSLARAAPAGSAAPAGGGGAAAGSGGPAGGSGGPSFPVLPQYAALVLGIVIQPYLTYYAQHGEWAVALTGLLGRLGFGVVVGGLAFPAVYKNAFDPTKPLFVQLCAIFAGGIGWQSVIQGGAKAALGS